MAGKNIKAWITINHRHIPIMEGETKEQAVKRFKAVIDKKRAEKASGKKTAMAPEMKGHSFKKHKIESSAGNNKKEDFVVDYKIPDKVPGNKKPSASDKRKQAIKQMMQEKGIENLGTPKTQEEAKQLLNYKGSGNKESLASGKSLSFERREGYGLNPSEYKLSNGDGISPKSLNPHEGNPTNIKKLKDMPGRTSRSTDEIIVKSNYGNKEYIVTREHYKDTKTGYHRAEVVDIRQRVGNKEESAVKAKPTEIKAASKPATAKPAKAEYQDKNYSMEKMENGHYRVDYSPKENGLKSHSHYANSKEEAEAFIKSQKESNEKQRNVKISALPPQDATKKPAVTEESIQKELSRTAARLESKGYNTPESIEKHIRELSSIRKNDLAKKMGIGGRGEEKIKAMVAKIHEQQQSGKKAEPAKTWQDKDEEIKQKQIANAEKQKAAAQEAQKPRYYSNMDLEDEQFRKDALEEMRRYERNWNYYGPKQRREIAPNGKRELTARIKEIEDYEKNSTIRKQAKELGLDPSMSIDQLKKAINTINNASPMTVSTAQRRDLEPRNKNSEKLDDKSFRDAITIPRGKAYSSGTVKNTASQIEAKSSVGDRIEAKDNNSWHDISISYEKTSNGKWRYIRKNNDNGEVYEDQSISTEQMTSEIMGYYNSSEPINYHFKKGK